MARFDGTNLADLLNGTELADLIFGNGGNDILYGNGGNDEIRAGSGNDILEGNAGDDRLYADSGLNALFGGGDSDILVSGSGADLLNGGDQVDLASWETSSLAVNANLATGRAFTISATDTLVAIENLLGSGFSDVLFGDASSNDLYGGAGNDVLSGGDGSDRLFGGSGDDTLTAGGGIANALHGDAGTDTVDFTGAAFADVDLARGSAFSSVGLSSLATIENVRATFGNDFIAGDKKANRIETLGGNDHIDGGEGNDVLMGGSGADTFVFKAVLVQPFNVPGFDSGDDTIADFGTGDRIDLRGHFEATTFAELKAGASQFGADTVLLLGEDTIRIADFSMKALSADMVLI